MESVTEEQREPKPPIGPIEGARGGRRRECDATGHLKFTTKGKKRKARIGNNWEECGALFFSVSIETADDDEASRLRFEGVHAKTCRASVLAASNLRDALLRLIGNSEYLGTSSETCRHRNSLVCVPARRCPRATRTRTNEWSR